MNAINNTHSRCVLSPLANTVRSTVQRELADFFLCIGMLASVWNLVQIGVES